MRRQAAEDLARIDSPEGARLLLEALEDPAPKVRDEAVRSLGRLRKREALEAVARLGLASPRPVVRLGSAEALGHARASFDRGGLARMAAEEKDPLARLAAIRALGRIGEREDFDLLRRVESEDPEVAAERLRALAATDPSRAKPLLAEAVGRGEPLAPAALRLLGEVDRDAGLVEASRLLASPGWRVRSEAIRILARGREAGSIEPLIRALGAERRARLREDLVRALRSLTGMRYGTNAAEWEAWWTKNGAGFRVPPEGSGRGEEAEERTTAAFFGIPLRSDALVFALDFSGSMREPVSPGAKETRKDRVLAELARALRGLPRETRFDVLLVRLEPEGWSRRGLQPATPKAIGDALAFVERAVPEKSGDFWKGLRAALEGADADTVCFLSDGNPSAGAFVYRERLVEALDAFDRLRQVRVSTVLAGDDERHARFLRELAEATGGDFRAAR